jgi:hypothetical protein
MAAVQRAQAALAAAGDDEAQRRGADAELRLRREALAEAHADLRRLEREARGGAQQRFDAELRAMAARVAGDLDAVLAGALALHRAVSLARGRDLRIGQEYAPLPREAERLLEGWRTRLRRVAEGHPATGGLGDAA